MEPPSTGRTNNTESPIRSPRLPTSPNPQRRSRAVSHSLSRSDGVSITPIRMRSYPMYVNSSEERFVTLINPVPQWLLDEPLHGTDSQVEVLTRTTMQHFSEQTGLITPANQTDESDWSAFSLDTNANSIAPNRSMGLDNVADVSNHMLLTPEEIRALEFRAPSPASPAIPLEGGESSRTGAMMGKFELFGPVPKTPEASTFPQQLRRDSGRPKPKRRLTESAQLALSNCIRDSPLSDLRQRTHMSLNSALLSQSITQSESTGPSTLPRGGFHLISPKHNLDVSRDPGAWSQTASRLESMTQTSNPEKEMWRASSSIPCYDGTIDPVLLRQPASRSGSIVSSCGSRMAAQRSSPNQNNDFAIDPIVLMQSPIRQGEQSVNFAVNSALLTQSPTQTGEACRAPLLGMEWQRDFLGRSTGATIDSALLSQSTSGSASVLSPPIPIMGSQTPQTLQAASIPPAAGLSRKRKQFNILDAFAEVTAKQARRNNQM